MRGRRRKGSKGGRRKQKERKRNTHSVAIFQVRR